MDTNSGLIALPEDKSASIRVQEVCSKCSGIIRSGDRQWTCDKLLMKLKMISSFSKEIRALMKDNDIPLSKLRKGIELKIGIETKCNRCKNMDYKIIVII